MKKFITIAAFTAFGFGAAGPAMADNYWRAHRTTTAVISGQLANSRWSYGTEWDRVTITKHEGGKYTSFNVWAKCSGGTYTTWRLDGPYADQIKKAGWGNHMAN